MATFSKKERMNYQNICHLSEQGILQLMDNFLVGKYSNIVTTPDYLYAIGDIPVALIAHADTVFKIAPLIEDFYYDPEKDVIWNAYGAGADDRAGVFAIMQIIRKYKLRPHIIITTKEETGCIGASKLCQALPVFPDDLRFMIQLDRRGCDDAVFYDCDNKVFEEFITKFGFKTQIGTLSDISILAPGWKVAAVNLSIGYEDEHFENERLHVDWMYATIYKVASILQYVKENLKTVPVYEYIPKKYTYQYNNEKHFIDTYPYNFDDFDDWEDSDHALTNNYDYTYRLCTKCNKMHKKINMLPVYIDDEEDPYYLCLDCYAEISTQVVWCKKCHKGFFLSQDEMKNIKDVHNWTCERCENDQKLRKCAIMF